MQSKLVSGAIASLSLICLENKDAAPDARCRCWSYCTLYKRATPPKLQVGTNTNISRLCGFEARGNPSTVFLIVGIEYACAKVEGTKG